MAALGIGLVFIGYAIGLNGYCLFKGYDVTPKELWSPIWPPGRTTSSVDTGTSKTGHSTAGDPGSMTQKTK